MSDEAIKFDKAMNTHVSFDIPEQRKADVPTPANLSLIERMKRFRIGKQQKLHDDSLKLWVEYSDKVVDKYLK